MSRLSEWFIRHTLDSMLVTLDLTTDALRRLESEAARRGISVDDVIAEFAFRLPSDVRPTGQRLSFIGVGASGDTRPVDVRRERAELAERKLIEGI